MGLSIFCILCLLLVVAASAILRARLRMYPCRKLLERVKPLSDHAREVLAQDTQGHVPTTILEFSDMYRAANNLTWLTLLADQYRLIMMRCSNDYYASNMRLTYVTFLRNRAKLFRSLLIGFAHLCFGKIGKRHPCPHMANIARGYTDVLLASLEMAETMDRSCVGILEGQFLHGS